MSPSTLILASASPRRADLLRAAGMPFDVVPAHVDERILPDETPEGYVARVATEKARAVAGRHPGRVVLAADTAVVLDGLILGKPGDDADARRMLRLLGGRRHGVLTGVTLISGGTGGYPVREDARVEETEVEFAALTAAEIDWYVGTGEPRDKAGAYAAQGLASRFVTRIGGSYSNVVGLPVSLVYVMCSEAGMLLS